MTGDTGTKPSPSPYKFAWPVIGFQTYSNLGFLIHTKWLYLFKANLVISPLNINNSVQMQLILLRTSLLKMIWLAEDCLKYDCEPFWHLGWLCAFISSKSLFLDQVKGKINSFWKPNCKRGQGWWLNYLEVLRVDRSEKQLLFLAKAFSN